MWLANNNLVLIHYSHTHKKTHRTGKKNLTNLMGNLCCVREHSVQFFVEFFTQITAQFNLECMGPFRVYEAL
jgi:hypothetical protein